MHSGGISIAEGRELFDSSGRKVGTIEEVYVNPEGVPEFAAVRCGMFGTVRRFVPLCHIRELDQRLVVPHSMGTVRVAPDPESEGRLTQAGEADLYAYYGLPYASTPGFESAGHETGQVRLRKLEPATKHGRPADATRLASVDL